MVRGPVMTGYAAASSRTAAASTASPSATTSSRSTARCWPAGVPAFDQLQPFDVVCVMRERTPLSREVLERLPRLKMIASTGPGNASIDMQAVRERNIHVTATGYRSAPTIELTWALILAAVRTWWGRRHR